MEVVFILRVPGEHREIDRRVMPCVPREGELVAFGSNGRLHSVHSVTYMLPTEADQVALVYLNE
jgi:hypothetical protein